MIHQTAIVDPAAELGSGVHVGAWSIIGPDVVIGDDTRVGHHCVIHGPTRIGRANHIYQFNSIGDDPQDKKYRGERSWLEIGERNVIREYCTFNRGTELGGGVTRVGDDNWIMAYVHVAHDCQVGSDVVMANGATIAGHVRVDDHVTMGGFTMVHQFCAIGAHAFCAMGAVIGKDVPPFVTVAGHPARPRGINTEGLRRRGFGADAIRDLRRAYKTVYKKGLTLEQALAELATEAGDNEHVAAMMGFVERSSRGIVR